MKPASPLMVALALAACGAAGPAAPPAAPPSDDAIASWAGADSHFRNMLAGVVFSTQSVAMSAYALGIPENCALIRPAFDAAVSANLPAWRANLARAWRGAAPEAALAEAVAAGPAGVAAMQPYAAKAGAAMQAASTALLEQAAQAVVTPAMTAAMKVDPKTVEGAARMQQLKAAQADGSLFCGLMVNGDSKGSAG